MKNVVVVDTSIAIKWVLDEPGSEEAEALLLEWSSKGITLYAPALLTYELSNVLYKKIRRGELTIADARRAFAQIRLTGIELDFPDNYTLNAKAVELASKYSLPATYDAHFLALASARDANFGLPIAACGGHYRAKSPGSRSERISACQRAG